MTKESNSPIPDEFMEWARIKSLEHVHRYPANTTLMSCHDFMEGAIACYRKLSSSDKGVDQYKKAYEELNGLLDEMWNTRGISQRSAGTFCKMVCVAQMKAHKILDESPVSPRGGGGWISVEAGQEPEKHRCCWFVIAHKVGQIVELGYVDGDGCFVSDTGTKLGWPVTHWQYSGKPPLPSPPVNQPGTTTETKNENI